MGEFILSVKRTKHARLIYGPVMSIFLLFTGREISEQAPSFTAPLTPLLSGSSKQPSCVWSTVIESVPQETRTFVSQARHTLLTSQLETTLSLAPPARAATCDPQHFSLSALYRGLSVPATLLRCPCTLRTFSVTYTTTAIVSKYHASINHREHRILYLRTIHRRWEWCPGAELRDIGR